MDWIIFVWIAVGILSLSDFAPREQRLWPMIAAWVLMSMTAGFRNVGGYDYDIYMEHYYAENVFYPIYEYGYCAAVWLARQAGMSYNIFLATISAASLGVMFAFFWRRSLYPMLSVVIYGGTYFLFYNMVLTRQMVAVVACFYAIGFMMDGRFWKFVLTVVAGALFHYSILALLPAWLFVRFFKLNAVSVGLLAGAALLFSVFRVGLMEILASFFGRGANYLLEVEFGEFSVNPIEWAKIAVMLPLIAIYRRQISEADPSGVLVKYYLLFVCLIIGFRNVAIMVRVAMYFDLSIMLLVPIIVSRMKLDNKAPLFLAIGLLSLLSIVYRFNNFPGFENYKFFFL